ncbi:cupin domain-containing protein [Nocardia sp. NPDC059240]|uniref:cupin domain-containing protein n=1 Tax=Nocardia sp. NPDC059240 TaxID=3346786 RepID=UPI0036BAF64A
MKSALRVAITAAIVGVAAVGCGATAAATPGQGISARLLGQGHVGDSDYVLREYTLAPGGSTGWHYQDGAAYVHVISGTLSHYGPDCALNGIHGPGDISSEPPGPGNVHDGRNEGSEPVVMDVLYIQPTGMPTSVDTPAPNCAASTASESIGE